MFKYNSTTTNGGGKNNKTYLGFNVYVGENDNKQKQLKFQNEALRRDMIGDDDFLGFVSEVYIRKYPYICQITVERSSRRFDS